MRKEVTRSGGCAYPCSGSGGSADGLLGRVFYLSGRVGGIAEGVGVEEVQPARVALSPSVSGSRCSGTVGGRTISTALGRGSLGEGLGSMSGRFPIATP